MRQGSGPLSSQRKTCGSDEGRYFAFARINEKHQLDPLLQRPIPNATADEFNLPPIKTGSIVEPVFRNGAGDTMSPAQKSIKSVSDAHSSGRSAPASSRLRAGGGSRRRRADSRTPDTACRCQRPSQPMVVSLHSSSSQLRKSLWSSLRFFPRDVAIPIREAGTRLRPN